METNQQVDDVSALKAELERIKAENEALKAQKSNTVGGLSITPKGTIRVPNIGMFGLCLYQEQWARLFTFLEIPVPKKLADFIEVNKAKLAVKPVGHVSKFKAEFEARGAAKKLAAGK